MLHLQAVITAQNERLTKLRNDVYNLLNENYNMKIELKGIGKMIDIKSIKEYADFYFPMKYSKDKILNEQFINLYKDPDTYLIIYTYNNDKILTITPCIKNFNNLNFYIKCDNNKYVIIKKNLEQNQCLNSIYVIDFDKSLKIINRYLNIQNLNTFVKQKTIDDCLNNNNNNNNNNNLNNNNNNNNNDTSININANINNDLNTNLNNDLSNVNINNNLSNNNLNNDLNNLNNNNILNDINNNSNINNTNNLNNNTNNLNNNSLNLY